MVGYYYSLLQPTAAAAVMKFAQEFHTRISQFLGKLLQQNIATVMSAGDYSPKVKKTAQCDH
jgi:hypothetical protein